MKMMPDFIYDLAFYINRKLSFPISEQIVVIKQINSYLATGTGIKQTLLNVQQIYQSSYGDSHVVVQICKRLIGSLASAPRFDALLESYFAPTIALGFQLSRMTTEEHKNDVLDIVNLVDTERKLINKTRAKLIMPMLMFILGNIFVGVIGQLIIPMILKNKTPPDTVTSHIVMQYSGFLADYSLLLASLALLVVAAYTPILNKWRLDGFAGEFRNKLDGVWPLSLYRAFWATRVLRLLGYMKQAGSEEKDALKTIKKYCPPYVSFFIDKMLKGASVGLAREKYFGIDFVSKAQLTRLRGYFTEISDADFAKGLVVVSHDAELDIEISCQKAVMKWWMAFFLIGAGLIACGVGAMMDMALILFQRLG